MIKQWKKIVALTAAFSMAVGLTGCSDKNKKEPKPEPKATAVVDDGNTDAKGKGEGHSDVPLVIACSELSRKFNPFVAESEEDKQAVELTQASLVINDRSGKIVYHSIDGEMREYDGTAYTYYGPSDIKVRYNKKKDKTRYTIRIREDLSFSDGEKINIDDVIFTMYAYCDPDYEGSIRLGEQNIIGLLNYQTDNKNAESLTEAQVKKYIRKMPEKLSKWIENTIYKEAAEFMNTTKKKFLKEYSAKDYKKVALLVSGNEEAYDAQIERKARKLLAVQEKKSDNNTTVDKITGIRRLGDYKMSITTKGYDANFIYALQIPICPLHYYGDVSKYNFEKNCFGFQKGDISSVQANQTSPLGAGPYRFIKYEKGIAYYMSNEIYYLGCPEIAYVQLKETKDILEETQKNINTAILEAGLEVEEQEKTEVAGEDVTSEQEVSLPSGISNRLAEITEMTEGTYDVISKSVTKQELNNIAQANSNEEITGKTVETQFEEETSYQYIGIHAENVKVGNRSDSQVSKNLRKAFATVISACRPEVSGYYDKAAEVINYPTSYSSWIAPQKDSDSYQTAYNQNVKGEEIYKEDADAEERYTAAKQAAVEYLQGAGFKLVDGVVTKAPKGASKRYTMWVVSGKRSPYYPVLEKAASLLSELGMTLKLVEVKDEMTLMQKLQSGKQQLWCGESQVSEATEVLKRYDGENLFGIKDVNVNSMIEDSGFLVTEEKYLETSKKVYDLVEDWSVEIPFCQIRTVNLFSASRIDMGTVTPDSTSYYSWIREIEKIKMK